MLMYVLWERIATVTRSVSQDCHAHGQAIHMNTRVELWVFVESRRGAVTVVSRWLLGRLSPPPPRSGRHDPVPRFSRATVEERRAKISASSLYICCTCLTVCTFVYLVDVSALSAASMRRSDCTFLSASHSESTVAPAATRSATTS